MIKLVIPFEMQEDSPFYTLEQINIMNTYMYVSRDLKNIFIHSETSMGSNMNMHFAIGKNKGFKVDFDTLDKLRPSTFCNNLKFLDDYTAGLYNFTVSSFLED